MSVLEKIAVERKVATADAKRAAFYTLDDVFANRENFEKWVLLSALHRAMEVSESVSDWRCIAAYIGSDFRLLGSSRRGIDAYFFSHCELSVLEMVVDGEDGIIEAWSKLEKKKEINCSFIRMCHLAFDGLYHLMVRSNRLKWMPRLRVFVHLVEQSFQSKGISVRMELGKKFNEFHALSPNGCKKRSVAF